MIIATFVPVEAGVRIVLFHNSVIPTTITRETTDECLTALGECYPNAVYVDQKTFNRKVYESVEKVSEFSDFDDIIDQISGELDKLDVLVDSAFSRAEKEFKRLEKILDDD